MPRFTRKTLPDLQKRCASGDTQAIFELGCCYGTGKGLEKDDKKALDLCMLAASNGHIEAMRKIGEYYARSGEYNMALKWLEEAARGGDDISMFFIGRIYENGKGGSLPAYESEAAKWYEKASGLGNYAAQERMADMYYRGTGLHRNYARAAEFYANRALEGDSEAQYRLGMIHMRGTGPLRDGEKAVELFGKASGNGHILAMYFLGVLHMRGKGACQDYNRAKSLFERAAQIDVLKRDAYRWERDFGSIEAYQVLPAVLRRLFKISIICPGWNSGDAVHLFEMVVRHAPDSVNFCLAQLSGEEKPYFEKFLRTLRLELDAASKVASERAKMLRKRHSKNKIFNVLRSYYE